MIASKTAQKKVETTKNNLEQNKSSRYPGNPRCKKCKIPWGRFQVLAIFHSAQDFKVAYLHLQHPEGTQGIIGAKKCKIPWGTLQLPAILHSKQDFKVTNLHFQHIQGTQGIIGTKNVRSLGGDSKLLQFFIEKRTLRPRTYIFHGQPPNTAARIFS